MSQQVMEYMLGYKKSCFWGHKLQPEAWTHHVTCTGGMSFYALCYASVLLTCYCHNSPKTKYKRIYIDYSYFFVITLLFNIVLARN